MSVELCDWSELPKSSCAHCNVKEEPVSVFGNDDEREFEIIGHPFPAQYGGVCTLDYDHRIRRGDRVAKVQRADNPMLIVSGVACKDCIKGMPHA